jgi:maltose alpha-D-glucosyltransferase/alpha-amylase
VQGLTRERAERDGRASATDTAVESVEPASGYPLAIGGLLGQRTAEMHRAYATPTDDPAFAIEPLTEASLRAWTDAAAFEADSVFARLRDVRPSLAPEVAALVDAVLERRDAVLARIGASAGMKPSGGLSRIHGDYHLGQVLLAQDDVAIIDFEGEPARTLAERRAHSSPLRDVAGMLRSFDYAAAMALDRFGQTEPVSERTAARVAAWRQQMIDAFVEGYRTHIADAASLPQDATLTEALLELFLLQKAVYETSYELGNRPDWLPIPLRGILDILKTERQ